MSIIQARGVEFAYGRFPVLRGIDLDVERGEVACLTGDNGCGKSTLLKVLISQNRPDRGTVNILGQENCRTEHLPDVGYVPQTNVVNKISFPITARELVVQGLSRDFGWAKVPRRRHFEKAEQMLSDMGLGCFARVPFGELSGGLQQRVLIARALIDDPKLVFLDEPTVGVDKRSLSGFLRQLEELTRSRGLTIVMVTHELEVVSREMNVDSIYTMEDGVLANA